MALCPECGFEEPTSQWESLPSAHGGTLLPCKRCQVIKMEYNRLDSIRRCEARLAQGTGHKGTKALLMALQAEGSRLEKFERKQRQAKALFEKHRKTPQESGFDNGENPDES